MEELKYIVFLIVSACIVQIYCKPADESQIDVKDNSDPNKRGWSDYSSWGKKWGDFATWGKRWGNNNSWSKKWKDFAAWGKRSDPSMESSPDKRKWSSFSSWGKRNAWKSFAAWGKRASALDKQLTERMMDLFDANGATADYPRIVYVDKMPTRGLCPVYDGCNVDQWVRDTCTNTVAFLVRRDSKCGQDGNNQLSREELSGVMRALISSVASRYNNNQ